MRRILLGSAVAAALLIVFFLVYFSFSGFRMSGQSYLTSLSDFSFMLGSYHRQLVQAPPPALDQEGFTAIMDRFRASTHWEVRDRLIRTLKNWGAEAAPFLVRRIQTETDPYRLVGAADALAAIKHPGAGKMISLRLVEYSDEPRRFRRDLVDALGQTGDPAVLGTLIDVYRRYGETIGNVLEAIGKCGGTDFLLAELQTASSPEAIRGLIWPLAFTRDPRAAKAVAEQLLHRDRSVRIRAYSALGQTMGIEAVEPLIEVLRGVGDEYILAAAINHVLARGRNRGSPSLVPYLASLIDHPTLAWQARYALTRVGGPKAVLVLESLVDREQPDAVMAHLDDMGEAALPILKQYLNHSDARVRRQAIFKTEELLNPVTRPLLEPLLDDPDRYNRRYVRRALFDLDRLDLLRSFTRAVPEPMGRSIWYGFRNDMDWGFRKGYRLVLGIFSAVHWVGIGLSGLLGLLLVMNQVRIFESFRFTLFVAFLLAEGLVGDFFFLGSDWSNPRQVFTVATAVHLLLLIGFLFQERERLPGELRGRFERLGGASLWLLAPPLLFLGTPLVAEGLRLALREFFSFLPYVLMAVVTLILVLEQWAIPWRLFPRTARLERLFAGLLAGGLLMLFVWPLLLVVRQHLSNGDQDSAVLAAVLILPLLWMFLFHLVHVGLLRPSVYRQRPAPPPGGRFEAVADGDRINIRLRSARTSRAIAIQALSVLGTGILAAGLAGRYGGGGGGMHLALIAGLAGAALAGLVIEAVQSRVLMQVRRGFIRSGITRFGATLAAGSWYSRPILTSAVKNRLAAGRAFSPLSAEERRWLLTLCSETSKLDDVGYLGSAQPGRVP